MVGTGSVITGIGSMVGILGQCWLVLDQCLGIGSVFGYWVRGTAGWYWVSGWDIGSMGSMAHQSIGLIYNMWVNGLVLEQWYGVIVVL